MCTWIIDRLGERVAGGVLRAPRGLPGLPDLSWSDTRGAAHPYNGHAEVIVRN